MTEEQPEKPAEERCERCKNYVAICGHDLPFSERIKHISIDRTSLRVK